MSAEVPQLSATRIKNWSYKTSTAILLAAMMVVVPALGSGREELLQDTLKSMLVAFFALSAAIVFFWDLRYQSVTVKFHGLFWLPLLLMTYALASMGWSHAYLAAVETIRWFIFSLLLFLGMNIWTLSRVTYLAWGIHLGAVIASLWAALQYWFDFQFFAQGPNPASTFVNRNFFAEYIVCTIPFSILLLTRLQDKLSVFLITFSIAFNITALLMTGTRSALLSLAILTILLPILILSGRRHMSSKGWSNRYCAGILFIFVTAIFCMGTIPSSNSRILDRNGGNNALTRALDRTGTLLSKDGYTEGSIAVRMNLWRATARMIASNPIFGVGAGAWEVQVPIYQSSGSQLETDYYAHNDFLQLLAEYGLVGWIFSACIFSYLTGVGYRTWRRTITATTPDALFSGLTLASLLALFIVSSAGFPLRLATTGAIFALGLSILVAFDLQRNRKFITDKRTIRWNVNFSSYAVSAATLLVVLAAYLSHKAIESEEKLVSAIKMALTISHSRNPNDAYWSTTKANILTLTRQGIAINPHYRKLTPIIADTLAGWGDWVNAIWIWESVHVSRPQVVAITANIARGYLKNGDYIKAQQYLDQAKTIQPKAPALATLEVMLWSQTGRERQAVQRCKELLRTGLIDRDLLQTAYYLGTHLQDPNLSIQALELGIKTWPDRAVDGWLKLGALYASPSVGNVDKARESYQAAMSLAPMEYKASVQAIVPAYYR